MRLKHLLFAAAATFSLTQAKAQAWVDDSVAMGPNYGNDVFYSMANGAQPAVSNTNWHLAFQMTPPGPYGNVSVFANHVQTGVKVYALHMRAATNFTTLSAMDTVGKTGATRELFNADSSWNYGAFNRLNNASDPFDYSWGTYDINSHNVLGDSLYLVTVPNGSGTEAYKIWIKKYVSTPAAAVEWQVRIAKFDGTKDTTLDIYRQPGYTDRLFAYYDVVNQTVIDREPSRSAWDIVFTRYKEYLVGAPGVPYYNVTGVLSNFNVTVNEKQAAAGPDDTTGFAAYSYSKTMNVIGSDWKTFNMTTNQWQLATNTYYFVKTPGQATLAPNVYQLHFTGFAGSGTGKIWFKKRLLGTLTGVADVNSAVSGYRVAPNPANAEANIIIDSKEESAARLMITDLTGRVVYNKAVNMKNGLNAFTFNTSDVAAGTYIVTLTNGSWKVAEKLVVQH